MRCRLLSIVLALLAAGLLLACAAQRPKIVSAVVSDMPTIIVSVTSEADLKNQGRISGRIVDASGQIIIRATVKVIGPEGKVVSNVLADDNGEFVTPPLRPGSYAIIVESQGFYIGKAADILTISGSNIRLQCTLTSSPETVNWTGCYAPMIDQRSTTAGAVITESETGQVYVDPY